MNFCVDERGIVTCFFGVLVSKSIFLEMNSILNQSERVSERKRERERTREKRVIIRY